MTVSIETVTFTAPVLTGDVVSFLTCTEGTGRSSVKVRVQVVAERYDTGRAVTVTDARLTMVSVDGTGKSMPFSAPPSVAEP